MTPEAVLPWACGAPGRLWRARFLRVRSSLWFLLLLCLAGSSVMKYLALAAKAAAEHEMQFAIFVYPTDPALDCQNRAGTTPRTPVHSKQNSADTGELWTYPRYQIGKPDLAKCPHLIRVFAPMQYRS